MSTGVPRAVPLLFLCFFLLQAPLWGMENGKIEHRPAASSIKTGVLASSPHRRSGPPWQQGIRYRIEARLDEDREVLSARAQIRYENASPDTLTDFYFHLYLNAFRPNSAWARHDLDRGIRTFQDLGPSEHGFERVAGMRVDGTDVSVLYPYAPDSTILKLELPRPLPPGGAITLEYDWEARPSSVPRRQGRRGRQYDFAQWYPRVVAYDLEGWAHHPLYRAGEFYGDFATYDVTLELKEDQVVGSTGVPLEGDPGWEGAAAPGTGLIRYQREYYGPLGGPPCVQGPAGEVVCGVPAQEEGPPARHPLGLLEPAAGTGWKQVRFFARDVHHFAWSTSPDYTYEHGSFGDVAIHVLYQPGDEESWGNGIAVERTATALEWLDWVFGPYLYPQVTNVHRIEGGGTEFPMMVMDGSSSLSLIIHEVGHIYAMGMLANNEWKEGWLDEGLSTFQTSWFAEKAGLGGDVWKSPEMRVLDLELRGLSEPVVQPAERFATQGVYGTMVYTKGSLIFRMLRDMVGEEAFRDVLRAYFERYQLRHVDQEAFQTVAEEILRTDLDWFFGQWLHATGVVDYGIGSVQVRSRAGKGFETEIRLERNGEMVMPVPLRLEGPGHVFDTVVDGSGRSGMVRVTTAWKPERVRIDPHGSILDWYGVNDHWPRGVLKPPSTTRFLGDPLQPVAPARREVVSSFFPLLWYNDAGGITLGLQRRANYMGTMGRTLVRVGLPALEAGGRGGGGESRDRGSLYVRFRNPIVLHRPLYGAELELFGGEGRVFARGQYQWDLSRRPGVGHQLHFRVFSAAAGVYDEHFLSEDRWEPEEHSSGEWGLGLAGNRRDSDSSVWWDLFGAGGLTSLNQSFVRGGLTVGMDRDLPRSWAIQVRAIAAGAVGWDPEDGGWKDARIPRQRRFFLGGGGPYETLGNPFLRSLGSPMEEIGFTPGDGGLRGVEPRHSVTRLIAVNMDLISPAVRAGPFSLRSRAFSDVAFTPGFQTTDVHGDLVAITDHPLVMDAGLGFEIGWATSPIRLRIDLPLLVGDPALAVQETQDTGALRARVWVTGY